MNVRLRLFTRLNTSARHGEWIDIDLPGGATKIHTYVVYPEVTQKAPVVIVIQEILQDKIYLDTSGAVQMRANSAGDIARRAMLGDVSSDLSGVGDD